MFFNNLIRYLASYELVISFSCVAHLLQLFYSVIINVVCGGDVKGSIIFAGQIVYVKFLKYSNKTCFQSFSPKLHFNICSCALLLSLGIVLTVTRVVNNFLDFFSKAFLNNRGKQ